MNVHSRYRSTSDVSMRHQGTFVGRLQDSGLIVPYQVRDINGSLGDCRLHLLKSSQGRQGEAEISVALSDSTLILDRPDCGLVNHTAVSGVSHAVNYITTAHRQYKRSLCFNQLTAHVIGNRDRQHQLNVGGESFRREALVQFFQDNYPTFQQALTNINGGGYSVAFSRKFALLITRKGIVLVYGTEVCGHVREGLVILLPQYVHLQEQLDEATA